MLLVDGLGIPLADPGGRSPPPAQQDPFLLFLHTFLPKSVCVGGRCPDQRVGVPPTGNPGSATEYPRETQ